MCSLCGCNSDIKRQLISFDLKIDVCVDCLDTVEVIEEFCEEPLDIAV